MRNALLALVLLLFFLLLAAPAHADPAAGEAILGKVVDATNGFFQHDVERLTHEMLVLRVDADQRSAKIGVNAGLAGFGFHLASSVTVVDGTARISPRLALAVDGKSLDLQLPTIDVAATSYRGERGVEVRLPLLRRAF